MQFIKSFSFVAALSNALFQYSYKKREFVSKANFLLSIYKSIVFIEFYVFTIWVSKRLLLYVLHQEIFFVFEPTKYQSKYTK